MKEPVSQVRRVASPAIAGLLALAPFLAASASAQNGWRLRSESAAPSPAPERLNRDEPLHRTFAAELHGGVAIAGCGFRGTGPPEATGTITISGIPPGARIVKAILNWTVMGGMWPDPVASLEYAGGALSAIVGEPLGEDQSPCWPMPFIYGFRAELCSELAPGANGVYTVRVPDSGDIGSHPSAEGATLIVVWEESSAPARDIVIYEGLETQEQGSSSQTITGFDASTPVSLAQATFVVSDGQGTAPEDSGRGLINGFQVIGPYWDGDDAASCTATDPRYYDVDTVAVRALLSPGDRSLVAVVESGPGNLVDCLTWSAFVLEVSTATAPGLPGCPGGDCPPLTVAEAGPDPAICAGQTARLDGSASLGCAPGELRYRWLDGVTPVCDWSASPLCDVAPAATTAYRFETACAATLDCAAADEAMVTVKSDAIPPDLGNSLKAIDIGFNVLLTWRPEPLARAYALHRGVDKGVWPGAPAQLDLAQAAAVDVNALQAPPALYFYRVVGLSCSGIEGL